MPQIIYDTVSGTYRDEYIDVTARLGVYAAAYVAAGDGVDRVVGGAYSDTLLGEGGNDQLVGNGGNDSLDGGVGNDQMSGGADNDVLDGGIGNDTLNGDAGNDTLLGGAGLDLLNGGFGNDTLDGGDDVDSLSGNDGDDSILAGAGDDRANGGANNDTIDGGLGADTIDGSTGNDSVLGGAGNDTLLGGEGDDALRGGDDNDIVMGAAGNDLLFGDSGNDTVEGGLGSDTVDAGAGDDFVKQTVAASANAFDVLDGGAGTDTLTLAFSTAQWQTTGIQTDIAGLSASFANLGSLGNQNQAYSANTLLFSALHFEKLIVSVDGNYAPTDITLAGSSINENVVAGIIGQLTTTDATTSDTITYTVDDNRFEVLADGKLALKAGIALNHEDASSIALNITATDTSLLSIIRAFTVNVANVNEAPVVSAAVAAKYATAGTASSFNVSTAFTDPDFGDTLTWSTTSTLPTGVTFNAATHVFSVASTATAGLTAITIKAQDVAGLSVTNTFSLSISSPTTLANGVYSADNQNNFLDFRGSASGVSVDAGQGLDTIYGSNFNDSIIGGNGNQADAIYGGSGNDTSSGGNGADIFWYTETNSGNDIITDFADGSDLIRFTAASGITAFSQLSPVTHVSGTTGPVKISWAGGSIVFQNITNPALITSADFLGLV